MPQPHTMLRRLGLVLALVLLSCRSEEKKPAATIEPTPRPISEKPNLATRKPDAPNLLLVVMDTVRRDHLSTYGYGRDTSPNLTGLARRGHLFTACQSTAAWTHPAHASMLTGLYPSQHGARYAGKTANKKESILALGPGTPLLHHLLAKAGYETFASVGAPVLSPGLGVTRGFKSFKGSFPDAEPSAGEVNSRLFSALDRRSTTGPVFVLVNYYDAHGPYTARPEHAPWLKARKLVRQIDLAASQKGVPRFARLAAGLETLSVDIQRAAIDNYDSEIVRVDFALDELFRGLGKRGLLQNAFVVVTADHGEYFGEHGLWEHGRTLYREMLDVPLVAFGSNVEPGRSTDIPVQLVDLFPTFLEAAGLSVPRANRGSSLWPFLSGHGKYKPHPIAAEAFADPAVADVAPVYSADYQAIQGGGHKLIRAGTRIKQLFDLSQDPKEMIDLSEKKDEETKKLSETLDLWLSPAKEKGAPASFPEVEKKRLQALGYL